jgi:DNA-binding NarL/FixJ family response regulator
MRDKTTLTLTPRQRQVAALARSGANNKEIAAMLGIEVATVKSFKKVVSAKYAQHGIDLHTGTLIERAHRLELLRKVAQRAWVEANFGLECK